MFLGVFQIASKKAARERAIRNCVDCFNARRYAPAAAYLTEDVQVCDTNTREISGRDEVLRCERQIGEFFPDRNLVIETMHEHRGSVLVRGHFESDHGDVAGPALWQVDFEGDKIARVEVTRREKHITLPKFALALSL